MICLRSCSIEEVKIDSILTPLNFFFIISLFSSNHFKEKSLLGNTRSTSNMQHLVNLLRIFFIFVCLFFIVVHPSSTTYSTEEPNSTWNGTDENTTTISTVSTTRLNNSTPTVSSNMTSSTTTPSSAIGGPIHQQTIGLVLFGGTFLLFKKIN